MAKPDRTDASEPISVVSLHCSGWIDRLTEPPPGFQTILGVVALPTSQTMAAALQTGPTGETGADRLFAKTGLVVKAGASFELVVPPDQASEPSIGWGSPATFSDRYLVAACEPDPTPSTEPADSWLAYPGGYRVGDPGCVSLVVRSGDAEQTVTIGVGAPCPGQLPPIGQTDA